VEEGNARFQFVQPLIGRQAGKPADQRGIMAGFMRIRFRKGVGAKNRVTHS